MASRASQRANNYKRALLEKDGTPTPAAAQMLGDLKRFCFGDRPVLMTSTVNGMVDPLATAAASGRQEVWFRIVNALNFNEMQIAHLRETLDPEEGE